MIQSLFIIDDDPVTIKICELVIGNAKFAQKITTFVNGKVAIDFFSNYFEKKKKGETVDPSPELILLDLNMPVMDGWEFAENFIRKYSSRLPETKIAILSSSVNPQDFMKSQQYDEIIDFIHKPLMIDLAEELKQHEALRKYF
jgi:CheY-like chemotaxis protein